MTNFGQGFKAVGDEVLEKKKKRGFCWKRVASQKFLSYFTQLSSFGRYKEIVGPYFSGIY
jgi:hypothetical protein